MECWVAPRIVNTLSQIKHLRVPRERTTETLPTWSVLVSARRVSSRSPAIPSIVVLNMCCLPESRILKHNRRRRIAARLFHQSAHTRSRNSVLLRYLSQTHAGAAVMHNLIAVHVEPRTTDLPTFEPRPVHPRRRLSNNQLRCCRSKHHPGYGDRRSERRDRRHCP